MYLVHYVLGVFTNTYLRTPFLSEIVMPFDLCFLAGIFWQQGPPLVVVSSSSICNFNPITPGLVLGLDIFYKTK